MTALEAALAKLNAPTSPKRVSAYTPITDAQAAEARRYIANGRPTKLANGGTVFTHGKES